MGKRRVKRQFQGIDVVLRPEVNPYVQRIREFPGRIFLFEDEQRDRGEVCALSGGRDLFCEIGSGSGAHLLGQARMNPRALYFGFELRYKRATRTIEKAQRDAVDNIFVLRTDAREITNIFAAGSLRGIWMNFPDPWQKRKDEKHRLMTADYIKTLSALVMPGGFISVKTDHAPSFERLMGGIKNEKGLSVERETDDLHSSQWAEGNILTEFEKLFRYQKLRICHAQLRVEGGATCR